MALALALLLAFGILTLWIPAAWPVSSFEIGVFILSMWAVCRVKRQPPLLAYPLIPLSFAVGLGLFQLFAHRTVYAYETTQSVVRWLTFLCVFFVASAALHQERELLRFRESMLWFSGCVALVATLQLFTGGGRIFWLFQVPYSQGAMGPILSYNHFGAFIELLLPLALYRALRETARPYLYATLVAVLYASVIACTSRAGAILSTAGIVVVACLAWRRKLVAGRHTGAALARIVALLVLAAFVVGWAVVWNRLIQADPMAYRRELDLTSLHMIQAYPWTGVGLGAWPAAYAGYAVVHAGVFANQAHCDWLQWTAEGGVPFGLAMLLLFAWSLRLAWRNLWGLGIVLVFLHACVDYPFSRPALGSFFIVMLAMLATRSGSEAPPSAASAQAG